MNLHLHLAGEWVFGFYLLQIFHKCSIGGTAGLEPARLLYKIQAINPGKTGTGPSHDSFVSLYH